MRRLSLFMFILLTVILVTTLVSASIQICGDKDFKTTEKVSVKSSGKICYNDAEEVMLYVVNNKNALSLIVLESQEISNSQFSCLSVWDVPSSGEYDVFVDCNKNGVYNADSNEPFDSFKVTAVKGSASASRGEKDTGDHEWMYDQENPDLVNEMLQIKLIASGEDIELENITIQASGTEDNTEIEKIEVYVDGNNNGLIDENDELIGNSEPADLENNGKTEILLYYTLEKNLPTNIIISYILKETIQEGEYSLSVTSLAGTGYISEEMIKISDFPLSSGKTTILPAKSCLGSLTLELEPNPVVKETTVISKISGLTGCQDKTLVLRSNPCGSSLKEKIGSCIIGEGEGGCNISFIASKNQTIHACIDKNNNGILIDFGEYDFEDLTLTEIEEEISEEISGGEITGIIEGIEEETGEITEETITGSVIGELKEKVSSTSSLFILLEITLLLILFVLVLMLFKMKGPAEAAEEKENAKE